MGEGWTCWGGWRNGLGEGEIGEVAFFKVAVEDLVELLV
jgi:hypothetical protein